MSAICNSDSMNLIDFSITTDILISVELLLNENDYKKVDFNDYFDEKNDSLKTYYRIDDVRTNKKTTCKLEKEYELLIHNSTCNVFKSIEIYRCLTNKSGYQIWLKHTNRCGYHKIRNLDGFKVLIQNKWL